jgi:hypothetical protein
MAQVKLSPARFGVKIEVEGVELPGVTDVKIHFRPDALTECQVTMILNKDSVPLDLPMDVRVFMQVEPGQVMEVLEKDGRSYYRAVYANPDHEHTAPSGKPIDEYPKQMD